MAFGADSFRSDRASWVDGPGIFVSTDSSHPLLDARQSMDRSLSAGALGHLSQCAVFSPGADGRGAVFCLPRKCPTDGSGLACGHTEFCVLSPSRHFFKSATKNRDADAPENLDVCLDSMDVFISVIGDYIDSRYCHINSKSKGE